MKNDLASTLDFVRTVSFSAGHRYALATLSRDENLNIYGSLYRDEGFGHNFLIEAHFMGSVDPMTGMIADLTLIDRWLGAVAVRFDHKFLNDLPEFQDGAPTLERIALAFFKGVSLLVTPGTNLKKIRIHEGDQTWVDYFG